LSFFLKLSFGPLVMSAFVYEDRWKLASHVQKAVRHGLPEDAEWGARALWAVDPLYLRTRLAVIAVEDVAGASDPVVLEHFGPGWSKRAIDARGGVEVVVAAARAMAESEKDRTACEFWACRHHLAEFEADHGRWDELTVPEAIGIAWDAQQPWWNRGLAAWRAMGTKVYGDRSEVLPRLEGDPALWKEACPARWAILDTAGKTQQEPHPVFLPLAWAIRDQELGQPARPLRPPVSRGTKVGPWLSAALDAHTAEGRQALRRVLAQNPAGAAFLTAHGRTGDEAVHALGKLWFMMEGGACDQIRSYPTADRMAQDGRRHLLQAPQPMNGTAFYNHFGDPERWHAARREVIGVAPKPSRLRL
jgi:hypothetical protein